ncbi:glutathione S-transferase family protein [Spongiibacter marinus]|uniref:glutathione S-transferase family protein n=1 Tax=Spongiibacter marinus TaxID=354246 RepID=UPI00041E7A57|nr:glutathione binding-like protein [Spongiibacter marinus]
MIDLHTVPTPNGHKISIALEELGLNYRVIPYDISQGDQFSPELLALNPNNKLPVIVDNDAEDGPITVFESGAILIYLAEKSGQLLSRQPTQRYAELQWLMFQMAGVGPLQGQAHHFVRYAREEQPYSKQRYLQESLRQCRVIESQLGQQRYIAGDQFSIADIALWPWLRALPLIGIHPEQSFPGIHRWFNELAARPAFQRGKDVINGWVYDLPPNFYMELDDKTWSYSFGEEQYKERERGLQA